MIAKELRSALTRRFDVYEERALDVAIEKAGALVEAHGSDIGEWSEETAREFCGLIITSFGASLREQVAAAEAPF